MGLDLSVLDGDNFPNAAGPFARLGVVPRAPLSSFEEDPGNPRFEEDATQFELLVADVREIGILQPLVVRRQDDGRLRICFGARRYRAALAAGLIDAPYVVTEDPRQMDDYAQVAENERRSPLQPLELATFAAKKIDAGEPKIEVARRLGIHKSALTHLLCLADSPPPFLLELYHSRRCRTPVYLYKLMRLWRRHPQYVESTCASSSVVNAWFVEALEGVLRVRCKESGVETLEEATAFDRGASAVVEQAPSFDGQTAAEGKSVDAAVAKAKLLRRPRLRGTWQGREVVLLIRRRPSLSGLIFVVDLKGENEIEIPISELHLTSLMEEGE